MPEPVRTGLIGAGAVGVFYTSLLQRESTHTTLITRQPHEYAVPIQIDSIHGQSPLGTQSCARSRRSTG